MDSPSRSHKPLSVNTTASVSDSPSLSQRSRSLGKKSSQAQLRGLFGRLRNKNSSLDFGCSGQLDEDEFEPAPLSAPASSSMSRQGSAASSFRSVQVGAEDGPGQSRRSSNADSMNSMSFPSPSIYSPPLYSLPASPSHGSMSDAQREFERKAEEKAAEEALLDYMTRASLSARKASLPTSSLMSPVELDAARAGSHRRTTSTSTVSTRSSLASRPRTNDSVSSYQSHMGSPATSLASSGCSSPSFRRPTFKGGVPEARAAAAASPAATGPRAYSFI